MQRLGQGIPVDLHIDFSRSPGQRTGPSAVVYIDGRRRSDAALVGFNPDDIATVAVLKAAAARQLGPDEGRLGVVIITTEAGLQQALAEADARQPAYHTYPLKMMLTSRPA